MYAATILFTDIVDFSLKPTAEQRRLVDSLRAEVNNDLRDFFNMSHDQSSIVTLPTGGGVAMAFLHQVRRPWDRVTVFTLMLKLHRWAARESAAGHKVSLRIGMHVGIVEVITDINGVDSLCGDAANYTRRVMDAAGPRQTLFSENAFREYVADQSAAYTCEPFSKAFRGQFSGPIEVFEQHGSSMQVYQLKLDPLPDYYANDALIAQQLMLFSVAPLAESVVAGFNETAATAKQLALIQYTGESLIAAAEQQQLHLSAALKSLWVFMPDPDSYNHFHLSNTEASPEQVRDSVQKWRMILEQWQGQYSGVEFKLGLFKEPPYFNGTFIDWERPAGKIVVQPSIWNVTIRNRPGFELIWSGLRPSAVYEAYVDGLHYLHGSTKNELM